LCTKHLDVIPHGVTYAAFAALLLLFLNALTLLSRRFFYYYFLLGTQTTTTSEKKEQENERRCERCEIQYGLAGQAKKQSANKQKETKRARQSQPASQQR